MKSLKKILACALTATTLLVMSSCSNNDDGSNAQGTSRMQVRMTDAPGDYDEVNVEVIDVQVKNTTAAGEDGWVSIGNISAGVYNLLDLTGGVTVLLADNEIPSGNLGQLRLVLGTNNTVVKNGVTYDLDTPSAQQSGLKLQVNQQLQANVDYEFLIDFDVDQSVVEAGGSGGFNLHPVLRLSTDSTSGSIRGIVAPNVNQAMASVIVAGQVVSAYADALGNFVIHGVPAGTYTVTVTSESSVGTGPVYVENVTVVNGQVSDIGNISL